MPNTEDTSSKTKICPTCGTRVSENAARCLVCGKTFPVTGGEDKKTATVQGPRMPEITLNLPVALGLMILILAIGAGAVYFILQKTQPKVAETPTATSAPTATATITPTSTQTLVPTIAATFTPLPPIEYTVQSGDSCPAIASAFGVSPQSIILANNLPAACNTLKIGDKLLVPQPTPTASPMPTSTLTGMEATIAACEKVSYTVTENDTLSTIASKYNVDMKAIQDFNNLTSDVVFVNTTIIIPLCHRNPTPGVTSTPTPPPPYQAPNLLLPADGAPFTSANETITLQWSAVGTLRENEAYAVTVEDVTEGQGRKLVEYTTDTKFIIPANFRPLDNNPHIMRWIIVPVRQVNTTKDGTPIYEQAGTPSTMRTFIWWNSTGSTPNP